MLPIIIGSTAKGNGLMPFFWASRKMNTSAMLLRTQVWELRMTEGFYSSYSQLRYDPDNVQSFVMVDFQPLAFA